MSDIILYDTTLRDGAQREGISYSIDDKLKIARRLDEFGVHYIEGGWPGSNPKDAAFFSRIRALKLRHAKIAAFGSTMKKGSRPEDDPNLLALLEAGTPVVTLVGKSWDLHVFDVLETSLEENLAMIAKSVAYMKAQGKEVIYDGEHFFDGYKANPGYALETLRAAAGGGAQVVVLCDTNGGTLPWEVEEVVRLVAARVGNANLCTVIPDLQLKMGKQCVPAENLAQLTRLSSFVAEVANLPADRYLPFVGDSAFAHKGGIHVAAVLKNEASYQHIPPELVGNQRRTVVSELSGRGNVLDKSRQFGLDVSSEQARDVLAQIKELEAQGFTFESAEGSVSVLLRRLQPDYQPPFELIDFVVVVEHRQGRGMLAEATVKVRVGEQVIHTAAEGNGPVSALDAALRKALLDVYPALAHVRLDDYKVRILDSDNGTGAAVRVLTAITAPGLPCGC